MNLKFSLFALVIALAAPFSVNATEPAFSPPLIPRPAALEMLHGTFTLTPSTALGANSPDASAAANFLAASLRPATGYPLPVQPVAANGVTFTLDAELDPSLGREGYQLEVLPTGVNVRAATAAGLFYGAQTFRQLLPPQAFASHKAAGLAWTTPCVRIQDRPRFTWRGFMLDTSRHFFPIDYLKQLVDDMASQKLNLLQLHLTDDDGWRIEIKKYPKLTEVGAWRGTQCALPNTREGETHLRYGGFYTQAQLKELVAYAAARHVNIVPEIDLPGHALAIVTAYPETLPGKLSEAVSAQGHRANAISPAKESNYQMIDDIIREVADIFPYPYIHIGGDEVNHAVWQECPQIKELMAKEKLGNLHQVQVHFTRRLEGIIAKHGHKMIGWQEIADDRLRKDTAIMAWIGPQPGWNAAKRGTPAVMAPGGSFYFDMPYPNAQDEPPSHWWAGPVGIQRAYEFDPIGPEAGLSDTARPNILGVQSALWTEFVRGWDSKSGWLKLKDEAECANYKIWPRLCATAELAWTPQAGRSFPDFRNRLGGQFARFAEMGRVFRLEPSTARLEKGAITLMPAYQGAKVKYTLDGTDPFNSPSAKVWDGQALDARYRASLVMRTVLPGHNIHSPLTRGAVVAPAGTWNVKDWTPNQAKTLSFPVADQISDPGRWRVRLAKTGGSDGLVIDSMELRVGSQVFATAASIRSSAAVLELKAAPPANLELAITARFTGTKPDAVGTVLIEKLAGEVIPGLTIDTKIPHYGADHDASQLLDGDPETFQWSSRPWEKDETFTWIFPQALNLKGIELQSGEPNGTKDQLLDAVLEISADGATFSKVSGFQYGTAKATLDGTPIKAVRVRATGKSSGWVILQDLILRR